MWFWIACKVASYAFIPACVWVGGNIGLSVVNRVCCAAVDRLYGTVTITLKRAKIYVIHKGNAIEIDPQKRYIIVRGEVIETKASVEKDVELDRTML